MQEEKWFAFDEYGMPRISEENLSGINHRFAAECEMRLCELSLVAEDAAAFFDRQLDEGMTCGEILPLFWQNFVFPSVLPEENTLGESVSFLHSFAKSVSIFDKVAFASFFSGFCRSKKGLTDQDLLPFAISGDTSVAYVRNPFSDESYDVFSESFASCRVVYVSSLKEAVNKVNNGECGYCLLPLEEKGATRLFSAEKLIYKNDLHIVAVTPVFGPDGFAEMKYALVSQSIEPLQYTDSDDLYLDIRFPRDDGLSLRELLDAADILGMRVYRMATVQFQAEDDASACVTVVLKDEEKRYIPFLTFLSLFAPEFTMIGIYKNLE